ncbi:MAG: hypothetical protein ACXVXB_16350 [Nocardioidaceae bacterium]
MNPALRPRCHPAPLVAFLLLVLLAAGCSGRDTRPSAGPGRAAEAAAVEPPAAAVLRAWDVRRARAWSAGSVSALRDLYLSASGAGRSDVRRLRAYLDRGLVVRGMRTQLLALRVVRSTPHVLRVVVTDRLARAVAVPVGTSGPGTPLPRGAAATRTVTLVRVAGEWRVGAVVSGPAPR